MSVSTDYLLRRMKPTGRTLKEADPEITILSRRFQRHVQEAREQVKELFEIVDAMNKKKRRSREPK